MKKITLVSIISILFFFATFTCNVLYTFLSNKSEIKRLKNKQYTQ